MKLSRTGLITTVVAVAALAGVLLYSQRTGIRDWLFTFNKPAVPSAVPYASVSPAASSAVTLLPTSSTVPTPSPVRSAVNLDVTFVSQAPYKVWDADHEDFCEEASSLMAASYVTGNVSVSDIKIAEAALQAAKTWEVETFGYFESTTAAQTARMLREHFNISAVAVMTNPTEAQMREWVAAGKAVVVPSAGRMLGNPNFKGLGPLYHMLVVKGYTADGLFITNDPGTRLGADYLYAPAVLMNAIHDWNGGDVNNGARVVIVVG